MKSSSLGKFSCRLPPRMLCLVMPKGVIGILWFIKESDSIFQCISMCVCVCVCVSCSVVSNFLWTPWTVAHQAPLSMEFSRQEYWSGLPCPSPGNLPYPGIEPRCPALQADSFPFQLPGKPISICRTIYGDMKVINSKNFKTHCGPKH